jgi:hypothetical protein
MKFTFKQAIIVGGSFARTDYAVYCMEAKTKEPSKLEKS